MSGQDQFNPLYQRNDATISKQAVDVSPSDEKTALIFEAGDDFNKPPSPSFFQRHFKKLIALGICLVILIIILAVAVPKGIEALMGKYMREAQIQVYEMEVTNIQNGTAYVRISGAMSVDAPIDASGKTSDAYFDLLIPDPLNRSVLAKIGTIFLPAMTFSGLVIQLNVSTTMTLESDRLFHEFINDVLYNQTVVAYMDGEVTITAKIPVYGGITVTEQLTTAVSIDGMNGLDFDLLRMDLYESTNDSVSLWFELNIRNPSQFYSSYPLPLYFVNIRLYFNGTFLGFLEPQDLLIGKGDSFNVAIGSLIRTPANEEAIGKFLSDYIMGFDVPIIVNGTAKVDVGLEKNPDFPARVYVDWVMPGIQDDLIEDLFADDNIRPIPPIKITSIALLRNPLDFDIEVLVVEFDGYVGNPCNKTVSRIFESYYDEPLLVKAHTPLCVPLLMTVSLQDAICILDGTKEPEGLVIYAKNGILEVQLDQFRIAVKFEYGPLYATVGPCVLP